AIADGCGGTVDCGGCPYGTTCGGGGTAHQCGCAKPNCNGLCLDFSSDPSNCGACGNTCGGMQPWTMACQNSTCVCPRGYADCNHIPVDGCETNVFYDPHNCGACGNACAAPTVCSGRGQCVPCPPGQTYCALNGSSYCADLTSDGKSCGSCGNAC